MASIMEKEKIWYELVKTYQNNVNTVTFTTLLRKQFGYLINTLKNLANLTNL